MDQKLLKHFNRVEKSHWWWQGRRTLIFQLLKNTPPKKVLDVGCGTGETLSSLRSRYPKAKLNGIDYSPLAVKFAKSRGLKNIRKGDALSLPYADASFDAVLLLDVIEHFEKDLKLLKEIKRVLKPGGSLIITAPALSFIWSDHDTNQGHFRRYTRHRFRYLSKASGLKLTFLSYFNFFLSPPIIVIRLLGRLPFLKHLNSYDSKLNFDLAAKKPLNKLLARIFVTEVRLLKYLNYPLGISIAARLKKA